jgi:protein-tyrosine phosphatase
VHNRAAGNRSRWIEFAEVDNARDLGGLPVSGGGSTRFGVAYRSSTLQELTEADRELLLGRIGLTTLIDLRSPEEAAREGYGLLGEADVHPVNLPVRKAGAVAADAVPDASRVNLGELYGKFLHGGAESLVSAARIIADTGRHAVLFHCAGGKDRTGVLAAVLLDAVGVPAEEVVADYALTGLRLERIRARLVRLTSYRNLPPVRTGVLGTDPSVMRRFLTHLHTEYGGGASWLREHGLGEGELQSLRKVLVDES